MLTTRFYDLTDEEYLKQAGELSNKYVSAFEKYSRKEKACKIAANALIGTLFAYMVIHMVILALAFEHARSVAIRYQSVMAAAVCILWVLGIATVVVVDQARKLGNKAAKDVSISLIRKHEKNDCGNYVCEIETLDGNTEKVTCGKNLVVFDLEKGQSPYLETFFNDVIKVTTIVHFTKEQT